MMGMTVGIITGPIVAGILVQYFAWYAPFVYTAVGCLLVFIIALFTLPHSQKRSEENYRLKRLST